MEELRLAVLRDLLSQVDRRELSTGGHSECRVLDARDELLCSGTCISTSETAVAGSFHVTVLRR